MLAARDVYACLFARAVLKEREQKRNYTLEAFHGRDRFKKVVVLDEDLTDAIDWVSTHTAQEVQ